nr:MULTISPECIES: RHS repeat-associated core domain-containing protein [unclassified Treponema]
MKPKPCIYSQPNYLFRTAIEAEILFAVYLSKCGFWSGSVKTPPEKSPCSKKIGAESAMFNFVFFIMLKNKIEQSAAQRCLRPFELRVLPFGKTSGIKLLNLLNTSTDRPFENRHDGCKEREKINRRRTICTLRINFFEATPQTACIFSKEMTHTDNQGDNDEQKAKRYYYHSDHLGSAQFVTDWRGRQYEHIEYTPYGELWIEEVAAGLDKLPFRFTGKEMDEETGLYYYGARYLDPKYSRWLSGDPALNDYIPKAPINDEAKKHNENLPGLGGVYNMVNLHVYHYAGNNPVKYTDPDGESIIGGFILIAAVCLMLKSSSTPPLPPVDPVKVNNALLNKFYDDGKSVQNFIIDPYKQNIPKEILLDSNPIIALGSALPRGMYSENDYNNENQRKPPAITNTATVLDGAGLLLRVLSNLSEGHVGDIKFKYTESGGSITSWNITVTIMNVKKNKVENKILSREEAIKYLNENKDLLSNKKEYHWISDMLD